MVKKISIVCLLVVALLFSGCRYEYRGEYLDLYTVAINSVLWTFGASPQTDFAGDPLIEIMEEDDFGRVLFRYTEKYFSPNISFSSLIILQSKKNDFAYYYEDCNFISKEKSYYSDEPAIFDLDDINELKNINDWNQPVNFDKCVKKDFVSYKKTLSLTDNQEKNILSKFPQFHSIPLFLLTENKNGDKLCYGKLIGYQEELKYIVIILKNDSTFSIFEPNDLYNYQEELKMFKEQNSWY